MKTYDAKSWTIRLSAFISFFCGNVFWFSRKKSPLLAITVGLLLTWFGNKSVRSFGSEPCTHRWKINENKQNNIINGHRYVIAKCCKRIWCMFLVTMYALPMLLIRIYNSNFLRLIKNNRIDCSYRRNNKKNVRTWWMASSLQLKQLVRQFITCRTKSIAAATVAQYLSFPIDVFVVYLYSIFLWSVFTYSNSIKFDEETMPLNWAMTATQEERKNLKIYYRIQ